MSFRVIERRDDDTILAILENTSQNLIQDKSDFNENWKPAQNTFMNKYLAKENEKRSLSINPNQKYLRTNNFQENKTNYLNKNSNKPQSEQKVSKYNAFSPNIILTKPNSSQKSIEQVARPNMLSINKLSGKINSSQPKTGLNNAQYVQTFNKQNDFPPNQSQTKQWDSQKCITSNRQAVQPSNAFPKDQAQATTGALKKLADTDKNKNEQKVQSPKAAPRSRSRRRRCSSRKSTNSNKQKTAQAVQSTKALPTGHVLQKPADEKLPAKPSDSQKSFNSNKPQTAKKFQSTNANALPADQVPQKLADSKENIITKPENDPQADKPPTTLNDSQKFINSNKPPHEQTAQSTNSVSKDQMAQKLGVSNETKASNDSQAEKPPTTLDDSQKFINSNKPQTAQAAQSINALSTHQLQANTNDTKITKSLSSSQYDESRRKQCASQKLISSNKAQPEQAIQSPSASPKSQCQANPSASQKLANSDRLKSEQEVQSPKAAPRSRSRRWRCSSRKSVNSSKQKTAQTVQSINSQASDQAQQKFIGSNGAKPIKAGNDSQTEKTQTKQSEAQKSIISNKPQTEQTVQPPNALPVDQAPSNSTALKDLADTENEQKVQSPKAAPRSRSRIRQCSSRRSINSNKPQTAQAVSKPIASNSQKHDDLGSCCTEQAQTDPSNESLHRASAVFTFDTSDESRHNDQLLLLPPQLPSNSNKITLVLDLDDTLVHSVFSRVSGCDFTFMTDTLRFISVYLRPGVKDFILSVGDLYELVLFTVGNCAYAAPVIDFIDPQHMIKHRLFRESCTLFQGDFVKDLSKLGRDLNKVIILDDSPASYRKHPCNALPISSWSGDPNDDELLCVQKFLIENHKVNDVHDALYRYRQRYRIFRKTKTKYKF